MTKVVIVGAGTAGLTTASQLLRKDKSLDIVLVDPAQKHFYQPFWTLNGAGISSKNKSWRPMKDVIPKGVRWIQEAVKEFLPKENKIVLRDKQSLDYDILIVCAGLQIDWDKIEGLEDAMGKNGVCSNYSFDTVDFTWEFMQKAKSGNAIFTFPNTPIKCAGAPQKIMYLADAYFRNKGVRDKVNVKYCCAGPKIFGIEKYRVALEKIVSERDIDTEFNLNLEKIDGPAKKAWFRNLETDELVERDYEMIHVVPPMSAPDFIKKSPLAKDGGYVEVDQYTLQHPRYHNVFSLGDSSSAPNSKTAAAIRKQVPVVTDNILSYLRGEEPGRRYNGYASCPLVTGYNKAILAEFDYEGNPDETFPFDQSKERRSMYLLKRFMIPFLYWKAMIKGRT